MGRRRKFSCAQGSAERLPQVSQQLRNRLVYPKGHASSQALTAALGSNRRRTTAPALATVTPHASPKQTSHKVCHANNIAPAVQSLQYPEHPECIDEVLCADASSLHCDAAALMRLRHRLTIAIDALEEASCCLQVVRKQQAPARSASSSSSSTPRGPPTPPQPSLPISHQVSSAHLPLYSASHFCCAPSSCEFCGYGTLPQAGCLSIDQTAVAASHPACAGSAGAESICPVQGVPEAAAAAIASLEPVSAPASILGGPSSDEVRMQTPHLACRIL